MLSATAPPTRRQHLSALALAFLCAVLFLRDGLLPGRALVPHPVELFDVHMAEAMAKGPVDPAIYRGNLGMADKYMQSLCWDRVMQDRFAAAEWPRWTRDIGSGAPFVPQMAQPFEPINLLLCLWPSEQWYGWWYLVHLVLFGYFAWVFLRRLGCQHASALFGLVVAVLGTWTQCKLHHNVILTAALSVWPMLTAVHDLVAAPGTGALRRRTIGWLALWTGLSWSSGFVVVSLQATWLAMLWCLFLAVRKPRGERLRGLLPVGLGLALGGALAAANMLPILMAAEVAARSAVFDLQRLADHGLEWDHALSLCWPDLFSWAADRIYEPRPGGPPFQCHAQPPWSQLVLFAHPLSPTDGSAFHSWVETSFSIGAAGLGCVCLALFDRGRRGLVAFFAAAALLAFGVATADRPFLWLAAIVPGLGAGDLRRLLFVVATCLVVLSALGADALLCARSRWPLRGLLGTVAAASLAAVFWLQQNAEPEAFVHAYATLYAADSDHPTVIALGGTADAIAAKVEGAAAPGEVQQNQHMLATTAWRALVTALVAIAASFLQPHRSVLVLAAIGAVELLHTGLGPVQTVPARSVATPPRVLMPVLAAPAPNGVRPRLQRLVVDRDAANVAALPGNFPGYLGIEDASAYNPLSPARFEEFFNAIEPDRPGKRDVDHAGAGVGSFHDPLSLGHPLCDLFGIRFVLTRSDVEAREGLEDRTPPGTGGYRLLERTTTLPRATFVREIDVLPDKNERLATLRDRNRDVRHRVVLEDPTCRRPTAMEAGAPFVAIDEHRDERVTVTVRTQADGYLRLHDPYDAGWRVSVDGAEQTLYVADHYLRAVYVPPGEHKVEFTYDGARAVWPLRVSLLALVVVVVLLCQGLRRRP